MGCKRRLVSRGHMLFLCGCDHATRLHACGAEQLSLLWCNVCDTPFLCASICFLAWVFRGSCEDTCASYSVRTHVHSQSAVHPRGPVGLQPRGDRNGKQCMAIQLAAVILQCARTPNMAAPQQFTRNPCALPGRACHNPALQCAHVPLHTDGCTMSVVAPPPPHPRPSLRLLLLARWSSLRGRGICGGRCWRLLRHHLQLPALLVQLQLQPHLVQLC